MEPVILASSSPRRQEILKMLNIPFQVKVSHYDETFPDDMEKESVPEFIALNKVKSVVKLYTPEQQIPWIIGADTMILHNGILLGKPSNSEEAFDYINRLQGKTHKVITGIAVFNGKLLDVVTCHAVTEVSFKKMSKKEIEWYVEAGEWYGAAGGYRIQGLAQCFIKKINGSSSNVKGLPISELYDILTEQGYSFIE